MKYDVFISYRREGGYETAKHLNDLLVRDGYRVSFDIDTLRSGDFDTQLLTRIEQCKDFILIVDEHAFDRTIDPETNPNEDWLRCELAHALKHNKNIIPVFLSGVAGFPDGLPDDVVGVKTKQSPKYDMFYFDQFYKLLKEYLVSKPQKLTSILLISFVLLIAASLYLVLESGNKIEPSFYQQYGIIDSTNKELVFDINGVVFKMIKVDGGTFHMGAQSEFPNSTNYDVEAYPSEGPVHSVTLSDYYIGETEVTIELWETVMGGDISNDKDSLKPIGAVSYNDCIDFLIQLNKYTGKDFRLPTEAEFEYASRGGKKMYPTKFSGANNIDHVAWCNDTVSHEVKRKDGNELELYDMSGNVWEWCHDWYGDYENCDMTNPEGPLNGKYRVLRGGSWRNDPKQCRVSYRGRNYPTQNNINYGFRLAL